MVLDEEGHDGEAAALGAVVQRSVALDAAPVDACAARHEELCDLQVALVAADHQARVAVPVGDLDIWSEGGRVSER